LELGGNFLVTSEGNELGGYFLITSEGIELE